MTIGDPYISRAELKTVLGITDPSEDDLVDRAVMGATRAINNRCGFNTFWNTGTAVTRSVETYGKLVPRRASSSPYMKLILPDGIASATGFAVAGYSTASLLPTAAIGKGEPATQIKLPWLSLSPDEIAITAVWGWPSLPDDIVMACQMQAQRYYKRRGSPEGLAGSAEWGVVRIPNLDPDVKAILEGGPYMNPGIG